MTGHEALISLRRAGRKPACVFVIDGDDDYERTRSADWHHVPNDFANGELMAHVRVLASDLPEVLDLRFVVGLRVVLESWRSDIRGNRLFEALKAASPSILIACIGGDVRSHMKAQHG